MQSLLMVRSDIVKNLKPEHELVCTVWTGHLGRILLVFSV